ncbi:MAG: hypothetical protein ACOYJJ_02525 [Anaerovoracaceae bacterium]|jgi:hypothetical protein
MDDDNTKRSIGNIRVHSGKNMLTAAVILLPALFLCLALPQEVFADASLIMIPMVKPIRAFLIISAVVVVVEVLAVWYPARAGNKKKALFIVLLANIVSFLTAYIPVFIGQKLHHSLKSLLDQTAHPQLFISLILLAVTIAVELPIVVHFLKNDVPSRRKLFFILLIVNLLTSAFVLVAAFYILPAVNESW